MEDEVECLSGTESYPLDAPDGAVGARPSAIASKTPLSRRGGEFWLGASAAANIALVMLVIALIFSKLIDAGALRPLIHARALFLPCSVLTLGIGLLIDSLRPRPQAKYTGSARLRRRRATARQHDELASSPTPADDSYAFTSSRSHAPDAERCLVQCIQRGAPI